MPRQKRATAQIYQFPARETPQKALDRRMQAVALELRLIAAAWAELEEAIQLAQTERASELVIFPGSTACCGGRRA